MPQNSERLYGLNHHESGPLCSGPLIGEVSPTSARIWVQARSQAPLSLRVFARVDPSSEPVQVVQQTPSEDEWLCAVFLVEDLEAGVAYSYSFHSEDGETERLPLRLSVPADSTKLRIAFGSCYKDYAQRNLRIFDSILASSPDLFLLLGDTCYTDEDDRRSEATFMQAHLRNRNNDALARLVREVPTLGIWDDHDYGPNDKDGTYADKDRSLRCFRRMWAQASYGTDSGPGIFSQVRCGPVDLFLLDSRFYRRERAQILGEVQLEWLLSGLRHSTAPIKLILSGSQLLPEVAALPDWDWECFRRDGAAELERLQRLLVDEDIRGVVALSGDPHLGQLFFAPGLRRADGQCGPVLWELTSSPLANRPWSKPVWPADSHGDHAFDRYLLEEVVAVNFGTVDIDLERTQAEVRLTLCGEQGTPLCSYDLDLDTLRVRPQRPHLCAALRDDRRAYAFLGDHYVRYDLHKHRIDDGYPKSIADGWKGVFAGRLNEHCGLDAVYFSRHGKAYFFCGNGYVRFDLERDQADPGYPRYIKTHWHGVWTHDLCAILPSSDDHVYFVSQTECIRYNLTADRAEAGYPRPLHAEFPGLFDSADPVAIEAAIAWSDGAYYFLREDQVWRYDPVARKLSPGYPRTVSPSERSSWFGFLP